MNELNVINLFVVSISKSKIYNLVEIGNWNLISNHFLKPVSPDAFLGSTDHWFWA